MNAALFLAALLLAEPAKELRLIEVDPGHSHAAAIHTTMLPGFSDTAHIYAPLGIDLTAHLNRIAQLNNRATNPTHWALDIYAGPDYLEKMRQEPPGNVVILSGRNQQKIDYIETALQSGQNVLSDKPCIIEAANLPRLEAALNLAEQKGLVAYDCMTQRFDTAYQVERQLVADKDIFGDAAKGTLAEPAVRMKNLHALYKKASLRPAWYFDIHQQGEGIADVGTHLIDLAEWTLFPGQGIDYRTQVKVLSATRRPTILTRTQFEQVTGEKAWPPYLNGAVKADRLEYFTNNDAVFTIRGIHISVSVNWEYESEPGTRDSYFTSYQGTKSRIELREGAAEKYVPEIYLIPTEASPTFVERLRVKYPRFTFEQSGNEIHLVIPKAERTPDNQYYGLLAQRFLSYIRNPGTLPAWEKPNMLAKYYITTRAVQIAREGGK